MAEKTNALAEALKAKHGGHWGEHPDHDAETWASEVANGDTRLGYWEWVANMVEVGNTDRPPRPWTAPSA
jgi:hypothetical protein